MSSNFYYGTSGLSLPLPKRSFPPEYQHLSRLEYYAMLYNSIEINSSFYKIPQPRTIEKWAAAVPDSFRFTFKLFRDITHRKGLVFDDETIERFMRAIAPARYKTGCLLIQFPPSVKVDKLNELQQLLAAVDHYNEAKWTIAVEFRDASWYERETAEILEEYKASVVMHDITASAPPLKFAAAENAYIRFHGPDGNYRGSYDDSVLKRKAAEIRELLRSDKQVYVYFNNTIGDANKNLDLLKSHVNR